MPDAAALAPDDFTRGLWIPRYRPGAAGDWTIETATFAALRGYWGRVRPVSDAVILRGPSGEDRPTWMSIVPMEIESQTVGLAAAHGHTVVLGLGMGWLAANVALRDAVSRVTVVERDPDVRALIDELGVFEQLPPHARAKLTVVAADAFDWRPDAPVDSLQADIWAKLLEPQKWSDVHRMADAIRPANLYFWGQELELWRLACRAEDGVPAAFDRTRLEALVADTGLPLVLPDWPDLPERITEAARWWAPKTDGWWRS